ncbi:hypothetical protein C8R47DRAFT_1230259 [Mycena vitilis]|nr:hypothetical protein C8R47DRAFT_1230259 [Mycena vitilis]
MPKGKVKTTKEADTVPRKRGNQGDIHGKREEFLMSRLEEYRAKSAKKQTQAWWPDVFRAYWASFPWRLSLSQEPGTNEEIPDDKDLSDAEKVAKAKILDDTEAKIKRWFSYRRAPTGGASNPFAKFLRQLRSDERQPKRLPDWQVYMQDEEKNDAVNAKFAEDFPELVGAKNTINIRAQIARKLLAVESDEVKEVFRKRGDEDFEESMDAFKAKEAGGFDDPELSAEERQDARMRLATTVQPLLDSLRAYTGYHLTLLAGTVEEGRFDIRSVHAGKTKAEKGEEGKDFTRWDPVGYKDRIMTQFMRYLAVAEGADPVATAAASGPPPASKSGTPPAGSAAQTEFPPPNRALTPPPNRALTPPPNPVPSPPPNPVPSPPPNLITTPPPNPVTTPPPNGASPSRAPSPEKDNNRDDAPEDLLGHLSDVGSPLKRAVARLEGQAQLSRIWELERASSFHRVRESNIARNNEALAALGLQQEMRDLMKDVEVSKGGTKRKNTGNAKGRAKRARRDEEDFGEGDEDDSEGGESDREDSPTPRAEPRTRAARGKNPSVTARPARGRGRGSQATVSGDGVPKWAAEARETLLDGAGGAVWESAVELWWTREKAAGFNGPPKGANVKLRPKEVKGWVARARTGGPNPAIVDVIGFSVDWWKWWVAINPPWRQLEGGRRLKREGEGDWESAAQTGPNGMLNVLVCLRWWRDVLRSDLGEWEEALADVEWLLKEVIRTEGPAPEAEGSSGN